MPKALNSKTGEIIELPYDQDVPSTFRPLRNTQTDQSTGQPNMKALQSLFLSGGFGAPGSTAAGRYLDQLDKLGLLGGDEEDVSEEKSANEAYTKLGEIEKIIGTGKDVSGFIPGLKAKRGSGISRTGLLRGLAPSEDTVRLQSAISEYNTKLFEVAGKAFTGPEKELLSGLILDVSDDEDTMKYKIDQAKVYLKNKKTETSKSGGVSLESLWGNIGK